MKIGKTIDGITIGDLSRGLANALAKPINRPGGRQPNQKRTPIPHRLPGLPGKLKRRGEGFLETFVGVGPVHQQPLRGPPHSRPVVAHDRFPIDHY